MGLKCTIISQKRLFCDIQICPTRSLAPRHRQTTHTLQHHMSSSSRCVLSQTFAAVSSSVHVWKSGLQRVPKRHALLCCDCRQPAHGQCPFSATFPSGKSDGGETVVRTMILSASVVLSTPVACRAESSKLHATADDVTHNLWAFVVQDRSSVCRFEKVNGVLIPGGGQNLTAGHPFYDATRQLLDLTISANALGETFPASDPVDFKTPMMRPPCMSRLLQGHVSPDDPTRRGCPPTVVLKP